MATPKHLTTITAVAERLCVNELTVRRMIARGELTAYRIGKRALRLDADEVDALLTPVPVGSTAGYVKKGATPKDPGDEPWIGVG